MYGNLKTDREHHIEVTKLNSVIGNRFLILPDGKESHDSDSDFEPDDFIDQSSSTRNKPPAKKKRKTTNSTQDMDPLTNTTGKGRQSDSMMDQDDDSSTMSKAMDEVDPPSAVQGQLTSSLGSATNAGPVETDLDPSTKIVKRANDSVPAQTEPSPRQGSSPMPGTLDDVHHRGLTAPPKVRMRSGSSSSSPSIRQTAGAPGQVADRPRHMMTAQRILGGNADVTGQNRKKRKLEHLHKSKNTLNQKKDRETY